MSMKLFNTLGRELQEFKSNDKNEVRLYSCGPTVYNTVHIGNLRAYIMPDILKRVLELTGYNVNWVMNITDVDDKTIANAIKEFGLGANVEDLKTFTDNYFQLFLEDLARVGIDSKNISFVKVTEKIANIQLYILELIKKGFAYTAEDGSTYFSIEKYQKEFGTYGQLVGEKFLEGKKVGARVKVDEYDKENLSDFALWKAHGADDAQIYWDHPTLGKGRPGWHIECTLINYFKFPTGTDIHTGGVDLIFPHHTNEIAQAEPIYKPFVNYWMHSEHILVENKKMAKSAGNFFTLIGSEQQKPINGLAYRYLVLQSHYRSKLNVTKDSLQSAAAGLNNLNKQIASLKFAAGNKKGKLLTDHKYTRGGTEVNALDNFNESLFSDLNTSEALSNLFAILDSKNTPEDIIATAEKMDEVFGLGLGKILQKTSADISDLPEEITALINERSKAREAKDFKASDQLRKEIESKGYAVLDTADGTKITRL